MAKKKKDIAKEFDIWDSSIPSEISNYVKDDQLRFYEKNLNQGLNMIDLFCGAGGFSVGASWAGFNPVLGIDHFEPAIKTWEHNHPNAIACLGDIRRIAPEVCMQKLHEKGIDHIHLLTGGVPCQGFSLANRKHNDDDPRNFLFLEFMKYVRVFTPDYIILENVSGMTMRKGGQFVEDIRTAMQGLGYTVTIQLVNAAEYGVPQLRKRLLFVGVRNNVGLAERYTFPDPIITDPNNFLTVHDAFSDLPRLGAGESSNRYAHRPQNRYQELMRGTGYVQTIPPTRGLKNHKAPNHPAETIAMIAATPQGEPMYEAFKQRIRLNENLPSPTQLAGGIRPSFQFGHPTEARGLTTRERARIQSFPDSYEFIGGIVQERVQTGNAVPPLLIYEIVRSISADILRRDGAL